MTERATPRTDAAEKMRREYEFSSREVDRIALPEYAPDGWEIARQLERELAETRDESLEQARLLGMSGQREANLLSELSGAQGQIARLNQSLKSASLIYDAAKEQRDRLADACRMLVAIIGSPDNMEWATDDEVDAAYTAGVNALDSIP